MRAEILFETAYNKLHSESIQEWAKSEHNKPLFIQYAALLITKGSPDPLNALLLYIVSNAIGLW